MVKDYIEVELARGRRILEVSDKEMSVDDVVHQIMKLGQGAYLAKMDVKQAYRNVPVHPTDSLLLGMRWEDKVYVDRTLPFGLRSAPLIFSALADALQWMMEQRGASWVRHYVDDFVTVGPPASLACGHNMEIMQETCERAGMPIEPDKNEGPAQVITFLGLELDTNYLEIRLPSEKLTRLKALLSAWRGRKACKKRELLSLVGLLTHAGRAVKPGRSYVRRLIELSTKTRQLDHYVWINKEAKADIEWWHCFLSEWNGTAMMWPGPRQPTDTVVTSDASGTWGCGAYCGKEWFMVPWTAMFIHHHITVKELAPIVVSALVWGSSWRGKTVLSRCDNAAVVAIINSGSSKI